MAFDSRDVSGEPTFRSLSGLDFFAAESFRIGADPVFHAPLDTSFETLERAATFAYRSHALTCCPCGQDHSSELLAHKMSIAAGGTETGVRLVSEGPQFAPDGSPQSQTFNLPGEVAGSTATGVTIAVGDTVTSQIEVSQDQDWFRIELQAGVTYEFALTATGASPLGDPFLEIMNASGVSLKENDDGGGGLNSLLRFTPTASGTYYINAHGWVNPNNTPSDPSDDFTSTGSYTLTASQAPPLPTYTIAEIANYLVNEGSSNGRSWGPDALTYNIEALTPDQQLLAERALQAWAAVTPLTFTRTTGAGNITFRNTNPNPDPDEPNAAVAYAQNTFSGNAIIASTIVITSNWNASNTAFDSYTYQTYLHEVGHALGLGHGGPYNGEADYGTDNIYTNDNWAYTVMSYFDQLEAGHGSYRFVLGLQQADIVAAQLLYGANPSGTYAGNTTFGFNSSAPGTNIDWSQFVLVQAEGTYRRPPAMTIYDTGGVDTINLSGFSQPQILDLRPGTFSSLGDRPISGQPNYSNVVAIAANTIIENAVGGSGNDTITGNIANNTITLGAGADTFAYASGGGADTITDFAVAVDRIDLTAFSSAAALAAFNGRTSSGGGTLLTFATGQTILLQGVSTSQLTQANLILSASPPPPPPPPPPPATIDGTSGNDVLQGTANADTIRGFDGDDIIYGLGGNDTLDGGAGQDVLRGGLGADVLNGGNGFDLAEYEDAASAVVINLATGSASGAAAGDTFISIEGVIGSAHGDVLIGTDAGNVFYGSQGDDIIYGLGGNDTLDGGAGQDVLRGGLGADVLNGGNGFDLAEYEDAASSILVDLATGNVSGAAAGDTFSSIEGVTGSAFSDTISGTDQGNILYGGDGNDTLLGAGGNDTLNGGDGQDILRGGTGADVLNGGNGIDFAEYEDAASGVSVNLANGVGSAAAAGDTLISIEGLIGSGFADVLTGDSQNNIFYAAGGNDTLLGAGGNDTLSGGNGADTFVFASGSGADTVLDFGVAAGDRVDVSAIAGMTSLAALQAVHTQAGANSVFTFSAGNTVTLNNVTLAQLNAGHFVFASSAEPQDDTGKAEVSIVSGLGDVMDTPFDFSGIWASSHGEDGGERFLMLADFAREIPFEIAGNALSPFAIDRLDAFDFGITPDTDGWQM